jgi:hypothetical protein
LVLVGVEPQLWWLEQEEAQLKREKKEKKQQNMG